VVADWTWEMAGAVRHELDYLVEVDGDLDAPRLEAGQRDAFAWVGPDELELLMEGRVDGDRGLRDIVAKVTRIRLTDRLRLEPLGHEHVDDLVALHRDAAVAAWYDRPWSDADARTRIVRAIAGWEDDGADRWMAYDRSTGALSGRGGLALTDVGGDRHLEVGWALHGARWGRGYATEMAGPVWPSRSSSCRPRKWSPSPSHTTSGPARS
jgi:RimJ/RimL family protein N-acetyltransferase